MQDGHSHRPNLRVPMSSQKQSSIMEIGQILKAYVMNPTDLFHADLVV